jgi:hypothetical protein
MDDLVPIRINNTTLWHHDPDSIVADDPVASDMLENMGVSFDTEPRLPRRRDDLDRTLRGRPAPMPRRDPLDFMLAGVGASLVLVDIAPESAGEPWRRPVRWARGGVTGTLYGIGIKPQRIWAYDAFGRPARSSCWEVTWEHRVHVHPADKVWSMALSLEHDEPHALADLPWGDGP